LLQFVIGDKIPDSAFIQLHNLCIKAYNKNVFTNPGYDIERFNRSREFFVLAYDGKKIVGAWCAYSLKHEIIEKMYNENTIYDDILNLNGYFRYQKNIQII